MDYPVLIYDNLCTSCTEFAKKVDKLTKGKITIIGHFTPVGANFKESIFPDGYRGLEMSWYVTEEQAYGGRAGLRELLKYIFYKRIGNNHMYEKNEFNLRECTTDCKTAKGVAIRSCSILTNSKVIKHNT